MHKLSIYVIQVLLKSSYINKPKFTFIEKTAITITNEIQENKTI